MRRFGLLSLCLAAALAVAGCDDDETPTTPTTPTAPTVTETFDGTLSTNGGVTHTFSTTASGSVKATLTTLGPAGAVPIGMSLGNWNGTVCQIVLARDATEQGGSMTGNMSGAGTLCLRMYDAAGTIVGTVNYVVTVEHP